MAKHKEILEIVDSLSGMRPFEIEQVCRTTRLDAVPSPSDSSPAYTVARAEPPGNDLFRDMEIRSPAGPLAKTGGLIILTIEPGIAVSRTRVTEHYGPEDYIDVSGPEEPPGLPEYLVYNTDWGLLAVGVGKNDGLLKEIILEADKPK